MRNSRKEIISLIGYGVVLAIIIVIAIYTNFVMTKSSSSLDKYSHLVKIEENEDLYYYDSTGVVYIIVSEHKCYYGYGYMSPYYSANGNLYRYDTHTNKLIEIK